MRYLDPKADLTFKKVFGEHPDLVISLLNALLPFEKPEEEIAEIEYLTPELMPETPLKKNSIVDVRCKDKMGRQFLVEMQMLWSPAFMQRVLFNASKAYVRQLGGRESKYELLQPVYSLNLVNDIFLPDVPEAYHDYKIVQVEHTDKVIEGLRFIFVELPKFKPQDFKGKKMAVLWLRYLTEIDEHTRQAPKELLENPEICKAVTQIEESAFSDAQLWWYDDFWDAVRVENTLISDALREGMEQGIQQGVQQGIQQGIQQGMQQGMQKGIEQGLQEGRQEGLEKGIQQGIRQSNIQNARGMKSEGIPAEIIAKITGLTRDEVEKL
mgnify:FL=1